MLCYYHLEKLVWHVFFCDDFSRLLNFLCLSRCLKLDHALFQVHSDTILYNTLCINCILIFTPLTFPIILSLITNQDFPDLSCLSARHSRNYTNFSSAKYIGGSLGWRLRSDKSLKKSSSIRSFHSLFSVRVPSESIYAWWPLSNHLCDSMYKPRAVRPTYVHQLIRLFFEFE